MSSEKYRSLVAVYVMVVNEKNEVLFLKRANTGYRDGYYDIPAGHLEDGETLREAAARELKEEAGITAGVDDLEFLELLHRKSTDGRVYLDIFFRVISWSGEAKIMEPEKCSELIWAPMNALPEKIVPHQVYVLQDLVHTRTYREVGWMGDLDV